MSTQDEFTHSSIDVLFLSNFVHQVVSPLNGVAGTLDNISDGTYSGDTLKRKANAARGQLEACIGLVRNLAFFADLSSDNEVLRSPGSAGISVLPQIVIEAAQFYEAAASDRNIRISLLDKRTQYAITARPEVLRQVFMNLFDNAIKYADKDSTVEIRPYVHERDGSLYVTVTSIGLGFSGADREKLFDLNFRSVEAKRSKALGSGLGLYICRRIMNDFAGGSIGAQHDSKRRTTEFLIKFPRDRWSVPTEVAPLFTN